MCKKVLPISKFYPRGTAWNSYCKECNRLNNAKFYNPEWFKNNYQKKKKEKVAYSMKWNAANPMLHKVHAQVASANVKAKKYGVPGRLSTIPLLRKIMRLGNKCFYCGDIEKLGIDHKKALKVGGSNTLRNVVPACASCNSKKYLKSFKEFMKTVH